jgi:hypothetical protein
MIKVTQENEKTFTIEWDENDPGESIFNSFTEQDFIDVLQYYCEKELSKLKYTESIRKESGEINDDIEELTEHFFEDPYLQATNEDTYGIYHQENNEAP